MLHSKIPSVIHPDTMQQGSYQEVQKLKPGIEWLSVSFRMDRNYDKNHKIASKLYYKNFMDFEITAIEKHIAT